ncbi:SCO2322 family protein [Thermasporomyces composti]|uniref:MYXO-CTERM domain-containing protein n=1 Tax=Thermasporomyces composti TaxID=696763 RepID=A0A3D9V9U4_THECX|nr:SCO2322 family protein [Thermasporomyces composti]REF34924.1 hypothetical protein DFJ64_0290 [Thermasporomyces composti]
MSLERDVRRPVRSVLTASRTALAASAALVLAVVVAGPASAEAYRYWGFYQWKDGAWVLASSGPASVTPEDGAVDGWRLAVSGETTPPRPPRAPGDFEAICGGTPAEPGRKRVAVVVDYGLAEEETSGQALPQPRGACAVVDADASSAQVLAAVASVREENGLVCAIDSVPATGCGDTVPEEPDIPSPEPTVALQLPGGTPEATSTAQANETTTPNPAAAENTDGAANTDEQSSSRGVAVWSVVGVLVVAALVLAALVTRRRRGAGEDV